MCLIAGEIATIFQSSYKWPFGAFACAAWQLAPAGGCFSIWRYQDYFGTVWENQTTRDSQGDLNTDSDTACVTAIRPCADNIRFLKHFDDRREGVLINIHTYINRIRNDLTADYSKVWRLGYKLWSPKYQVVRISEGISLLTPSVGNNVNYGTVKIFGKLKNWFIDHREEFNRVVLWLNLIWLYLCNYTQTLWHRNSWKDAMKLKWISEFLIAQV